MIGCRFRLVLRKIKVDTIVTDKRIEISRLWGSTFEKLFHFCLKTNNTIIFKHDSIIREKRVQAINTVF